MLKTVEYPVCVGVTCAPSFFLHLIKLGVEKYGHAFEKRQVGVEDHGHLNGRTFSGEPSERSGTTAEGRS